jgi:hypothetical protein
MQGSSQDRRGEDLLARIDQVIGLIDDLRRERSGSESRTARLQLGAAHARARLSRHGTRKQAHQSGE